MMPQGFPPMDYSVDVSLEMEVTKNCELCEQKVTGILQSIIAVYSVSFGDIMKLEARANPNLFMAVIIKYRDHAKVNRLHFEGAPVTPQPGEGGGGYYNAPHVNYPYPYSPYAPPQQQFLAGNYGYPMLKQPPPPQKEKEAPEGVHKQQHTVPPPYAMQPPPPMPLSSYSYIEPPYWPAAPPSGGKCVIM